MRTLDEKSEAEGAAACEQKRAAVVGCLAVKAGQHNFLHCLLASMSIILQDILAMTNIIRSSHDNLSNQTEQIIQLDKNHIFSCPGQFNN